MAKHPGKTVGFKESELKIRFFEPLKGPVKGQIVYSCSAIVFYSVKLRDNI